MVTLDQTAIIKQIDDVLETTATGSGSHRNQQRLQHAAICDSQAGPTGSVYGKNLKGYPPCFAKRAYGESEVLGLTFPWQDHFESGCLTIGQAGGFSVGLEVSEHLLSSFRFPELSQPI